MHMIIYVIYWNFILVNLSVRHVLQVYLINFIINRFKILILKTIKK